MKNTVFGIVIFLLITVVSNSLFVVRQTERAVMLQFGDMVRADIPPGLHFKIPYINTVSQV